MGPEGPVDSRSMSCSVKGESKETKIPLPFPYPDLSDAAVQKSLGFSADQAKRVRAILGDSPTLCALLIREAARYSPAEREAQGAYYCFYTRYKSIGPNSLASPARRKQLWDKQAADRRAWRAERDKQPLVKRCLEVSKQFETVLTPEQTAKYQEMAYAAIEFAAINDPLTWSKIGASNEQNSAVLNICTETMTKSVKVVCTATKKMLAILDRSQREKLREDLQNRKGGVGETGREAIPQEPAASSKSARNEKREIVGHVVDYFGKEAYHLEPLDTVPADLLAGKGVNREGELLGDADSYVPGRPGTLRLRKVNHDAMSGIAGVPIDIEGRVSGGYLRTYPPEHGTIARRRPPPYDYDADKWDALAFSQDPSVLQAFVHSNGGRSRVPPRVRCRRRKRAKRRRNRKPAYR